MLELSKISKRHIHQINHKRNELYEESLECLEEHAAVRIQRSFRKFKFKKESKQNILPHSNIRNWSCYQIMSRLNETIPSLIPKPIKYFNSDEKMEFVSKLPKSKQNVCEKFNEHLFSVPENKCSYVIYIPDTESAYYNDIPLNSNSWVTLLSLEHLAHPPSGMIIGSKTTTPLEKTLSSQYPNVKHIVMFDDATHTGLQLKETMDWMLYSIN